MKKYFLRNADFLFSLALPRLSVHYGEERLRLQQRSAAGGGPHLYLLHLRQQDPGDGKGDALRLSSKESIHLDELVWFRRGAGGQCVASLSSCLQRLIGTRVGHGGTEIAPLCNLTPLDLVLIFISHVRVSCLCLHEHLHCTEMFAGCFFFPFVCGQICAKGKGQHSPRMDPLCVRWNVCL